MKRILVADDDLVKITELVLALSEQYEVVLVQTAEKVISRLKSEDFDGAVLDLFIPDAIDGINLAKKAREMKPDMPIVVNSSSVGFYTSSLPSGIYPHSSMSDYSPVVDYFKKELGE